MWNEKDFQKHVKYENMAGGLRAEAGLRGETGDDAGDRYRSYLEPSAMPLTLRCR